MGGGGGVTEEKGGEKGIQPRSGLSVILSLLNGRGKRESAREHGGEGRALSRGATNDRP